MRDILTDSETLCPNCLAQGYKVVLEGDICESCGYNDEDDD